MDQLKSIGLKLIPAFLLAISLSYADGGFNLPQQKIRIEIKEKDHHDLKGYFSPLLKTPDDFEEKIKRVLIGYLPKPYDRGCKEMISAWGTEASKHPEKEVRILYLKNFDGDHQQIFLVYTCFSSVGGYGDKYYDERLASLTITAKSSHLTMLPHSEPCNNCSDLTHIGMGDEMKLGGEPALSIYFALSNENPCCDRLHAKEEVMVKYFRLGRADINDILTLTEKKNETFHDDELEDSSSTYESNIMLLKDSNQNISQIQSEYRITNNHVVLKEGVVIYHWNNKRKIFEKDAR